MISVLADRPEIHKKSLTVNLRYDESNPDAAVCVTLPSAAGVYRFQLPFEDEIFLLPAHAVAKYVAQHDASAGDLIDDAITSNGVVRVVRHRIRPDNMDNETSEETVDEWAYALISGRVTVEDSENELRTVFTAYASEHRDFLAMVRQFASDDFYRCHHFATEYLRITEASETPEPTFGA